MNIEDRGYQFGDGIYEVVHLYDGRFIDEDLHLDRLERSLREIRLPMPMSRAALRLVLREVARRNRVTEGLLYMQVTRGVARRDHAFPTQPVPPALVVTIKRIAPYPTDVDRWGGLGHHRARPALGALRHQDREPAAQLPGPPGGARAGRDRGRSCSTPRPAWSPKVPRPPSGSWTSTARIRTRHLDDAILPGCTRAALIAELQQAGIARGSAGILARRDARARGRPSSPPPPPS